MREFFRKNRRVLVILLIVAVVASAFIYMRSTRLDTASQYQTAKIERGNLTATIGATGTVRARQTAVLIWQAAGTVDTVNVKVGDNVPADFVMAYLSKTSLPQSVIMAEADLVDAQKALDALLASTTPRAESIVALREAQEVFDKAASWRQELNGKIHIKEIRYKKIFGRTVPVLKEYRGFASKETVAKADEDLAVAKAKLDDAQREFDRLKNGADAVD